MKYQKVDLKKLEKLFGKWDDGYYDPMPGAFRRFSKGLYNLMSFTVHTVEAYELMKNKSVQKRGNNKIVLCGETIDIGNELAGIIDEYFKPRLFELGYLGAWAAFETYLKDVAWLKLSEFSKPLSYELITRTRNLHDIAGLYKRLLKVDIQDMPEINELLNDRQRRNKIAHSGSAVGYTSCFEIDELENNEYAATDEEYIVDEKLFCQTLANMWKAGDFLRRRFFKISHGKKY